MAPAERHTSTETFPALTGLRALAAFMVFFCHLPLFLHSDLAHVIQKSMRVGVNMFFVLSGFLIAYRYYDKAEVSPAFLKPYFIKRFARIYPLYFVILTAVVVARGKFDFMFLLRNYTLTHGALIVGLDFDNIAFSPAWSLTVEECFYLFAPFIFLLTKRYALWLPFILSCLIYLFVLFASYDPVKPLGNNLSFLSKSFWSNFFAFYAGIFMGLKIISRASRQSLAKPGRAVFTSIGVVLFLLFMAPVVYTELYKTPYHMFVRTITWEFSLPLCVAFLIYGLIIEQSILQRALSGKYMQLFGKSSYALYLLHIPVISSLGEYLQPVFGPQLYNLYVIFMFALCLTGSVVLYLYFEEPMNKLIRKRFIDKKDAAHNNKPQSTALPARP